MIHLRLVVPACLTEDVEALLFANPAVHGVSVVSGAAKRPVGDLVFADVAREAANDVISGLRSLDLHRCGSISMERVDLSLSDAAERAEVAAPGDPTEAVIWEEVEARAKEDAGLTASFVCMLTIAVLIGAVGVLTDSTVLLVGAMVVGPDFGPLAATTLFLHRGRPDRAWRAARSLLVGLIVSIAATVAFGLAVHAIGATPNAYAGGVRPLTSFVARPDGWSVVVAVLAGIAGTLALSQFKSGVLVGVLISVTTVPAASNIGIAVAHGHTNEAVGALAQLGLNLAVLIVVGTLTFRVEQRLSGSPIRSKARRARTDP